LGIGLFVPAAPGSLVNSGLFNIESDLTSYDPWTLKNLAGGRLVQTAGNSSLDTVNNDGEVEVDTGQMSLSGSFNSGVNSSYKLVLGGYAPANQFGQLNVQSLNLGGSLLVSLTNGFLPTNGASFLIATNVTRSGQFTSVSLPLLPSE